MTLIALLVLSQYPAGSPQEQYTKATQLITARQFGEATAILNTLAPASPKWAELYAARCSAQLGLSRPDTAAADCRYALSIKPSLYVALYGLATAEAQLGQNAQAAQHFREYAAAPAGAGVDEGLRATAQQKAASLEIAAMPPPPPAPPVVIAVSPGYRVAPGRPLDRVLDSCSSSLDCGTGGWCKDRGDGVKVCMNNGGHGDYCSNNLDCGSGGWCKDRGDGLKVCMDHGDRGEFCSNNLDCGSGLWCKPAGDGTKRCR